MTLDNDSWSEYFDSINVCAERLRAAVTLARVPLLPARAGRQGERPARGGLLEAIRFNRQLDEIEVAISQNGASGASVRYFVSSPRSRDRRGLLLRQIDRHHGLGWAQHLHQHHEP